MNIMTNSTATSAANVNSGSKLDLMAAAMLGQDVETSNSTDEGVADIIADAFDTSKDKVNIDDDENDESTGNSDEDEGEEESKNEEDLSWAKALGVDDKNVVLDDDGNFAGVNVKVDGVVSTVDLPTLIAGYQTTKSYTQKTQALAEERKSFEAIRGQASDEYIGKLTTVDKLAAHLQQKLIGEFQNIDWQQLRVENPGEYAALVQDYNLRQAEMDKVFAAIEQEKTSELGKKQEVVTVASKEYLTNQAAKLIENNPEWADSSKLKVAFEGIEKFLGEAYGFTSQEFAGVQDARLIELAKDAKAYRELKDISSKKSVKDLPKFQKSAGNNAKQLTKLEKLMKTAKSATGTKKREAQTNAIAELIISGG